MSTITGTIKSVRREALANVDSVLDLAAELSTLTKEEEEIVKQYQDAREKLLVAIESPVVSIAEIRYAKGIMKKDQVKNKDKRF